MPIEVAVMPTVDMEWSPRPDSNRGPFPYQGNALPPELRGRAPAALRFYRLTMPELKTPSACAGSLQLYADSRAARPLGAAAH